MYPNEQLINSIRASLTAGVQRDVIVKELHEAGWSSNVIERGLMLAMAAEVHREEVEQSPEVAEIASTAAKMLADLEGAKYAAEEERANRRLGRKRTWRDIFSSGLVRRHSAASTDSGLVGLLVRAHIVRTAGAGNAILIAASLVILGVSVAYFWPASSSEYTPPEGFTPVPEYLYKIPKSL